MHKYCKLSRYKIKNIMKHFCVDIPATKTAHLTDLNRNTVNRYYNLFRRAIAWHQIQEFKKFVGEIEIDESYFGAKRVRGKKGKLKRGRGTLKQPVFGIYERNGRVYTEIIPDCRKKTLQAVIKGKVSLESVIHSDSWRGYNGLVDMGFKKHFRVNHASSQFTTKKGTHINGIENFWSFTKRRLAQFNGVKKNFELHLKECEWRYGKDHKTLLRELSEIVKKYEKSL
jgi:transposase-like protein